MSNLIVRRSLYTCAICGQSNDIESHFHLVVPGEIELPDGDVVKVLSLVK